MSFIRNFAGKSKPPFPALLYFDYLDSVLSS